MCIRDSVAGQLARRVAGDPTDARLHVARVNHHIVEDEPDGIFAALVDVFFAFGDSGAGLRARLLDGARRQIEALAPWDFAGGGTPTANPYKVSVSKGSHTVTAKLTRSNGTTATFVATFTVT